MKAGLENIGSVYNVRLLSYKSFRHYGGREITTTAHKVSATLVGIQDGYQRYFVELHEPVCGYKKGHKLAICENDFDI